MTVQPIKFEEQFSKFKSGLQKTSSADLRLLHLLSFWPHLNPLVNNRLYDSHTAEFVELLISQCRQNSLADLRTDELQEASAVLSSLALSAARFFLSDDLARAGETVGIQLATKMFYVGEATAGLQVLRTLFSDSETHDDDTIVLPPGIDELDSLRLLKEKLGADEDPVSRRIESIARDWEILREETSHDRVESLFVEKHPDRTATRGRLRALQAKAQYASEHAGTHEVTFEHQIRSPDDPFVGSVYQALVAVQTLLAGSEFRLRRHDSIHAHFNILPSDHCFTGDSIGLAAALITMAQLLSGEVMRYERGVASGAAVTGGIDGDGRVLAVNNDTLEHKIDRAFFSPVKYLVLPRENLSVAQNHLAALHREYPRRRLKLVPVDQLDEAVRDRNIVRSEKICPGQYVIRKAHAYSRLAHIQIPLLIVLTYVLICLLYPKAWLWFDWNPEHVMLNDARDRIMVYNRDTTLLWGIDADCPPVECLHAETYDLDGDSKNEVVYIPGNSEAVACSTRGRLYVADHDGEPMFYRSAYNFGVYDSDSVDNVVHGGERIYVFESKEGPIIVSNLAQNYPGRSHLKIWSADGDLLGWYLHTGHVRYLSGKDIDGDGTVEILALAINNPVSGFGLFVIPSVGSHGVSPPHTNTDGGDREFTPGNQWHYIYFPSGELIKIRGLPYNCCANMAILSNGEYRVQIYEDGIENSFRTFFLDDNFRVISMVPGDIYWERRQMFVGEGKLPPITHEEFCRREMEQIRYWTPDGWAGADQLDR